VDLLQVTGKHFAKQGIKFGLKVKPQEKNKNIFIFILSTSLFFFHSLAGVGGVLGGSGAYLLCKLYMYIYIYIHERDG
jgi:hypothetical protein